MNNYMVIGILIGLVSAFLVYRFFLRHGGLSKTTFENAEKTIAELRLELAKSVSRQELDRNYVSRELFGNVKNNLESMERELSFQKNSSKIQQDTILRLTKEGEQRLSKEEVQSNYVPKDSFVIIERKLTNAETALSDKEKCILELSNQLTELKKKEEHLNEKMTTFQQELELFHRTSKEEFKNIATEVLEDKKKVFVDENKKELHTILDPFKTNLAEFKEKVEATRKEDIQDLTSLKKEIESLQRLNTQLSGDAQNLATALKSEVKMQGNWGEDRLNMILEVEGLQQYIDYSREEMYRDDEQEKNRRPDFILKLPNAKSIIIDSKVSLTAYVNYFNAATPEEKSEQLKLHLKSVTDHVNHLADKNYQSLVGLTTPDYVFLFMPIEPALTLAMNQNPDIFNNALKKKIVLITPTTLVATLKVVKILWQKENQVKNVEEIFRQCGELYNKFVSFVEDMDKIESALGVASHAYKSAMYSLKDGSKKGNTIMGRFEAIKKLEAKTNKQIPAKHLREIELLPESDEVFLLDKNISDTNDME